MSASSACNCCERPPSPYVMRLSGSGIYYACNNSICGFRPDSGSPDFIPSDKIYNRAETLFTYPSAGQPDWIPEDFNGDTFTLVETKNLSNDGCFFNSECIETSNINDRPPPPFRSGPTQYSEERGECQLCTPAEDYPPYWIGETPITYWYPPAQDNDSPWLIPSGSGIYYGFSSTNWPIGQLIAAGASIGFSGYIKTNQSLKWRFEHTFGPTCYLKVWFIKRIRRYDYSTSGSDFLQNNGTGLRDYSPITTYEILDYVYEWNPTQTPCIGRSGDSYGGVFNEYSGDNPYVDVIGTTGNGVLMNANYPIIYGAEQQLEGPINYCTAPKTSADINIAVWKYSFIKNYEPDDPDLDINGYWLNQSISFANGQTRLNGYPLDGYSY